MGFLVAVAVMVSFIGSLTLLPAIILLVKPTFLNIKKIDQMKTKTQMIAVAMIIAMLLPIESIGQTLLDGKTIAENTHNQRRRYF